MQHSLTGSVVQCFNPRRVLSTAVGVIAAFAWSGVCYSQPNPVVSWEVLDERITLREPVLLRLKVNNQTGEVVNLELGADYKEALVVTIITPAGTVVRRPGLAPGNGLHTTGRVRIEPGAVYSREYVLDEWYDFDLTGKYGISVDLQSPITVGNRSFSLAGESFRSVAIDAYDQAALRRRCDALIARAFQPMKNYDGATLDDAEQAMMALSYVRDPAAIPSLARALTSRDPGFQLLAVRTLEKFLTPESIGALIAYARGNATWASQAGSTLQRMAKRIQDPALLAQIQTALNGNQSSTNGIPVR